MATTRRNAPASGSHAARYRSRSVGFILVAGATSSAALLIFGPARRRIGSLQDAARKVGGGDLTARAEEDGGDEVTALAHTFNQITIDLAARAEQLRNVDLQRRMLLADVSHELMTPLTAMRGYLESLSMSGIAIDAETRASYLSIVGDEACRMEHIVRDLLDLARLEGARESVDWQDVPIEDVFGGVMARHERDACAKSVTLATSVAGSGDCGGRPDAARTGVAEARSECVAPYAARRTRRPRRGPSRSRCCDCGSRHRRWHRA